jgi:hypothetical protein
VQEPDGSWRRTMGSKVLSLTVGEPDAHYFAIPLSYIESKPSDVMHLAFKRAGIEPDESAIESERRNDKAYAGEK